MFQISPMSYRKEYLIRRPSPLAPLIPNACPHLSFQRVFSGQTSSDTSKISYKRAMNNPLLKRKPHEEQDRRRRVYLEKVHQLSEDKKWETRSEQILRKDFLTRQKEWELDQARSAQEAPQALDDDEREEESSSMKEVKMVDHILTQEDRECEALVSLMQDNADQEHDQHTTVSDYGSDEEEYDQLFIEVMSKRGSAERNSGTIGDDAPKQDQEMDISVG